jgi:hypothetical protein
MSVLYRWLAACSVVTGLWVSTGVFAQNGNAKKAANPPMPPATPMPVDPLLNPPGQVPANPAEKALKDLEKFGDPAELDKALQKIPQGGGADQMKEMLKTLGELQKIQADVFKSLPIRDFAQQLRTIQGTGPTQAVSGPVPQGGNKGRLGARLIPVPPAVADALSMPRHQGLWIIDVWPNSPADKAGLKVNDILVELAGKSVTNNYEEFMAKIFKPIQPDADVEAVVLRKGKRISLSNLRIPETAMDAPVQDARLAVDPRELFPPGVPVPSGIVPAGLSTNGAGAGTDHVPPLLDKGNTIRVVPGALPRPTTLGVTEILPRR